MQFTQQPSLDLDLASEAFVIVHIVIDHCSMLQTIIATSVLIASATAAAPSSPAVYSTYTASVTATCVGAACSKSTSKGTGVYSIAQNKTAWLPAAQGGQGAPTIVDFNKRTVFFLQSNNGRCEYTCPLDQSKKSWKSCLYHWPRYLRSQSSVCTGGKEYPKGSAAPILNLCPPTVHIDMHARTANCQKYVSIVV